MALVVGKLTAILDLDDARYHAGLARASSSMKATGARMMGVGRRMTMGVTLPLIAIGAAAVKTTLDFQKSMNTMRAVAGVPGPKLEKLRELAIDLGRETVFSANEAAAAMLELSKAGVSVADIMGGSLANALDLAAAGDLELAEAAAATSNAMNMFGLSGKQSAEAVDALAGAANASSADVRDLVLSLQMGGNAAASAGLSIQETSAALAAMADQGIKGSDAGTSLKTMLLALVPTTKKASDLQRELGLRFVDNNGNIKSLTQIAHQLQMRLGHLTQAQQQAALKVLFGNDAYRASRIVMDEGAKGMQGYIDQTSEVGNASEVAAAKMRGLPGAIEMMKGSIETALLALGNVLAPVIENIAAFITLLANKFSELPKSMQTMIVVAAAIAAALGPVIFIIGALVSSIATLAPVLAALAGPVGAVVAAIAALVAIFVTAYQKNEDFRNGVQTAWAEIQEFAREVWPQIASIIATTMEIIRTVIARVLPVIKAVWERHGEDIMRFLRTHWESIKGVIEGALKIIQGVLDLFLGLMKGDWDKAFSGLKSITEGAMQAQKSIITQVLNIIAAALTAQYRAIIGAAQAGWQMFKNVTLGAWEGVKIVVRAGINFVLGLIRSLAGRIQAAGGNLAGALLQAGRDLIQGLINGITSMIGAAVDAVRGAVGGVVDAAKGALGIGSPSKVFEKIGHDVIRGFIKGLGRSDRWVGGLQDTIGRAIDRFTSKLDESMDKLNASQRARFRRLGKTFQEAAQHLDRMGNEIARSLERLEERISNLRDNIRSGFEGFGDFIGQFGATGPGGEDIFMHPMADIRKFMQEQLDKATEFGWGILDLEKLGFGQDLIGKIAAAGPDALPLIRSLQAGGPELAKFVRNVTNRIDGIMQAVSSRLEKSFFGDEIKLANRQLDAFGNAVGRLTRTIDSAINVLDRQVRRNQIQPHDISRSAVRRLTQQTIRIDKLELPNVKTERDVDALLAGLQQAARKGETELAFGF